jgi:cation transport protein ChaC
MKCVIDRTYNPRAAKRTLLFAYGSLLWNPSIPFLSREPALVRGFIRRFWNKSADHRGTEEYNGLVVCLVDVRDAMVSSECVAGVVYELPWDAHDEILAEIDKREKYGYMRRVTEAFCPTNNVSLGECYVYCASEDPSIDVFLRPAAGYTNTPEELRRIAQVISFAKGPSGRNLEYLLKLKQALEELGFHDPHVDEIYSLCLKDQNSS